MPWRLSETAPSGHRAFEYPLLLRGAVAGLLACLQRFGQRAGVAAIADGDEGIDGHIRRWFEVLPCAVGIEAAHGMGSQAHVMSLHGQVHPGRSGVEGMAGEGLFLAIRAGTGGL